MFSFNKRGQAETVFEVLIAVILLSFVMLVGTIAMTSLSNTKCSKEIDIALSDLVSTSEKTASSALSSRFYFFDLPRCFGPDAEVRLEKREEQDICSYYCPGSLGTCYLLKYNNNKDKISQTRYRCMNISPLTIINPPTFCDNIANYVMVTESESATISRGQILIKSASVTTPVLCIYQRSQ